MTADTPHPRTRATDAEPARGCSLPGILLSVTGVALALRVAWGMYRLSSGVALEFPDEQQYWLMAESVRLGEGLVDELGFRATRMPLYPAILALFVGLGPNVYAATAFHWVLGAASAGLAAGLAHALFDRRTSWLAGLFVAVDPFLVFFSSLLLTETLFIAISLALWWAAWPLMSPAGVGSLRRWFGVGLLAALAVYARETGLGLVGVLLLVLVIRHRLRRDALMGSLLVIAVVTAALLPWGLRNLDTIGHFSVLTQRGGISLYDGVGPQATGRSDLGDVKQMPEVRGLNEVAWNRYFLEEALTSMRDDPMRIVRLAGVKMSRMWNPIPNAETYRSPWVRFIAAAWTLPTYALTLVGAILCLRSAQASARWGSLLLLLPAVYLSALHSLFVGSVRYRLGAVAMLHVLAAFAVAELIRRRHRSRETGTESP